MFTLLIINEFYHFYVNLISRQAKVGFTGLVIIVETSWMYLIGVNKD